MQVGKKRMPRWRYNALRVDAWTKSEARAAFKRQLGLARLPVGALVIKLP